MHRIAPRGKTSRVYFVTDMTKPGALEIPLGYIVEAVWPGKARWLGLIGRTRLTTTEIESVNLLTWPEIERPFVFLSRMFDAGWEGDWGCAAVAAEKLWPRSPLIIHTTDSNSLVENFEVGTDAKLDAAARTLAAVLSDLGGRLRPSVPLGVPAISDAPLPKRLRLPPRAQAGERRMVVEFMPVAGAA